MDNHKLRETMSALWASACQDSPLRPSCTVKDGRFVFTVTGNRAQWNELARAAGVPSDAERIESGDSIRWSWPSYADEIFGASGLVAEHFDAYEMRLPQLHMARLCQRAIEMRMPALVEAGTGTGKSLAYASVAMRMGVKVIISTSNKALQGQLYDKDLPFLQKLFPDKRIALAVGKSNYACRLKCDGVTGVPGFLINNESLRQWYIETDTGNAEEIDFAVDWKALSEMVVDDDCTGRHCPKYHDCFYYAAKAERNEADVIVTNHALLCLSEMYPEAGILPPCDVIVVDEAHKLPDYARGALGVEFTLPSIERAIKLGTGYADEDVIEACTDDLARFEREVNAYLARRRNEDSPQLGILESDVFEFGVNLADALLDLADDVWPEDEGPETGDEKKAARRAQRIRSASDKVRAVSIPTELVRWIDVPRNGDAPKLCALTELVRWIDVPRNGDAPKLCAQPHDVSAFIAGLAGVRADTPEAAPDYTKCTRCARKLTASKVHLLDGRPYGPECITHVDVLGDSEVVDLSDWLALDRSDDALQIKTEKGVIFCSATIAAPDMTHFLRTCGLPYALSMIAESPFPYADNAVLYAPAASAPDPKSPMWLTWLFDELRMLVVSSRGGAFLLFTSYNVLEQAHHELRHTFVAAGLTVLKQGEYPKLELARRFRDDGSAVLFATKSFFEGVSIDGDALRLVVVDKLPFEAPTPLTQAMEAAIIEQGRARGLTGRALDMLPFEMLRVPRMTIELKQATGRLIRTQTDRGVMAVLDSRLRSSQYGRRSVIPALPPASLTSRREVATEFLREIASSMRTLPTGRTQEPVIVRTNGHVKVMDIVKAVRVEPDGDVLWA